MLFYERIFNKFYKIFFISFSALGSEVAAAAGAATNGNGEVNEEMLKQVNAMTKVDVLVSVIVTIENVHFYHMCYFPRSS